MKKWLLLIITIIVISGTYYFFMLQKSSVSILVENNSSILPEVELAIYIDDSLYIEDSFAIGFHSLDYTIFHFDLDKGLHKISVKSKKHGLEKEIKFNLKSKKYIFVGFDYSVKSKEAIKIEKDLLRKAKMSNKNINSTIDSIITPKSIGLWVTDKMPNLK